MPKEERKKGTHLTWDDRHEIQKGLKEHRTFKEIAYIIGCSPDTVSKDIRRHRYQPPFTATPPFGACCWHRFVSADGVKRRCR